MIGPSVYRLAWKRRVTRRARVAAVALAAITVLAVFVPSGISTSRTTVVTGHSTFFNGEEHDPCLASIVGIMRYKVMWFNDMVLVERYNGDGSYLYVTENGTDDPRSEFLIGSGIFYDFVDPNGVEWHVDEAYWEEKVEVRPYVGVEPEDPTSLEVDHSEGTHRYYTWIVAVDKPHRDNFAGDDPHDFYNFVTLVNTCKFNARNRGLTYLGNESHTNQTMPGGIGPRNGHEKNTTAHDHESYKVALWVGGPPKIAPVGTETPNWVKGRAGADNDVGHDPEGGTFHPT